MKLGMNLDAPGAGMTDNKFQDLFIWCPYWFNVSPTPIRGDRNLPGPGAQTYPSTADYVRPGTYTLWCQGNGTILMGGPDWSGWQAFAFGQGGAPSYDIQLKTPGRITTQVQVNTPGPTGLRNLQLLPKGVQPGLPWDAYLDPTYIASLQNWALLRGMDWCWTVKNPGTWAQQKPNPAARIEGLVAAANAANRPLWVNAPVRAFTAAGLTTDWAPRFCQCLSELDPSIPLYLEVGDEFSWNGNPPWSVDAAYVNDWAGQVVNPTTGAPFGFKGAQGCSTWMLKQFVAAVTAARPAGATPPIPVLSGQCTDYYNSIVAPLAWETLEGWRPGAIACAPYAAYPNSGQYTIAALRALIGSGDVSGAYDLLVAGVQSFVTQNLLVGSLDKWKAAATTWDVPLLAYECGLGLDTIFNDPTIGPTIAEFWYDPRAGTLVTWFLQQISQYVDVACWYADARLDTYGARRNADDTASYVWQALVAWAQANP